MSGQSQRTTDVSPSLGAADYSTAIGKTSASLHGRALRAATVVATTPVAVGGVGSGASVSRHSDENFAVKLRVN